MWLSMEANHDSYCSGPNIRKRLQIISRSLGLPLKYRTIKVTGVTWHTVDYAKGSAWGRLCGSCKTQRVLWSKIIHWEELALAVTDSRSKEVK